MNENINKVIYGTSTLIDLTEDTVSPSRMYKGDTAHDASGAEIIGTAEVTVENEKLIMPEGLCTLIVSQATINLGKLTANNTGSKQNYTITYTDSGATITTSSTYGRVSWLFSVESGKIYTISYIASRTNGSVSYPRIMYASSDAKWSAATADYGYQELTETPTKYTITFTATSNILFFGVYLNTGTYSASEKHIATITNFQLEEGNLATPYTPYVE